MWPMPSVKLAIGSRCTSALSAQVESPEINRLKHVLIGKVEQLCRNMPKSKDKKGSRESGTRTFSICRISR